MKQLLLSIIKKNSTLLLITRRIQFSIKNKKEIRGHNNHITNKGIVLHTNFRIIGNNNLIQIQPHAVVVNTTFSIQGDNHTIIIEAHCKYKGGSICIEDKGCVIIIGKNTSVESAHITVTEPGRQIIIGNDCMLSHGIVIRTGDSHSIIDNNTKERLNPAKNIEIGNHVWIGADTKILKGVTIEHNSIIATGAIVTHDIPHNSIATGIPAKVIKENIDWKRERW